MSEIPVLSVQGVNKSFGGLQVLKDVHFDLNQNECIAIIGYSGCGKTTLLRILCALDKSDGGLVLLDGAKHEVPTKDALLLFQSFDQLQPWRTALKNVLYPLMSAKIVKKRADALRLARKRLADVGLSEFENAYPHTLSGGMKQRAAVARALALVPRVLLMDEPFASLDNITRAQLQTLTRRVCDKYGISSVLVTHSVEEAVVMADKVIVMDRPPGRVKDIIDNRDRENATARSVLTDKIMLLLKETGDGE